MDQDDKCLTYGHVRPEWRLEYALKKNGDISIRRTKVLVCSRCGGRVQTKPLK